MTASAAHPELLRRLIDDHLPAHIRLPADFLVWTQVSGDGRSVFSHTYGTQSPASEQQSNAVSPLGGIPVP